MRRLTVLVLVSLMVGCGVEDETGRAVEPTVASSEPSDEVPRTSSRPDGSISSPRTSTRPDGSISSSSTATTAQAKSLRDHDFMNRTYLLSCGSGLVEIPIVDGEWVHPDGPTMGFIDYIEVLFFDVSGDDVEEAMVSIGCGVGAGTVISQVIVMTNTPSGITQLGQHIFGFNPAAADGGLTVENPHYEEGDPRCCPRSFIRTLYRLRDGRWVEEGSTQIPVGE